MIPAQDPFAAYQPSTEPEQSSSPEKAATNRKVAVLIGGTTLVGASLAGLAWGMSQSDPDETAVSAAVRDDDLRIDKEGDIRAVGNSTTSTAAADAQSTTANLTAADVLTDGDSETDHSFSQAFRDARDEMGAGKFFTWQGSLYSTNFKEEWEAKPEAEQKTYFAHMGVAEAEYAPEPVDVPVEDDVLPVAPAATVASEPHPKEAEAEDGIPVSIEELKNAEYSSDKITIVDAVSIGDADDDGPLAVHLTDDQSESDEWIHHDSDMAQFGMPQYDSSMTDDLADDDDQNGN